MSKKFLIAVVLAAVIGSGAFAQLMIGVSGALYMDTTDETLSQTVAQFKTNAWYGAFVEIAGKHLGLGFKFNTSAPYTDPVTTNTSQSYDLALYFSYHLFGARAFLDPMLDIGGGALVQKNDNSSNLNTGTFYWYPGIGLGVNLGPIGVFTKFAFDIPIRQQLTQKDENNNSYAIPYYLTDVQGPTGVVYGDNGYFPNYTLTVGVKLIL